MYTDEAQKLLDLAKDWQTAAESHKREAQRLRSFAHPDRPHNEFYTNEAAREELKAKLLESNSQALSNLVKQLLENTSTGPEPNKKASRLA
jgi:hypothetical protein